MSSDNSQIVYARFPNKLFLLLQNGPEGGLRWSACGTQLEIDREKFSSNYLSNQDYFKASRFSSIIRQLNIYGFRSVPGVRRKISHCGTFTFYHQCFIRDRADLLPYISRRRNRKQASPLSKQAAIFRNQGMVSSLNESVSSHDCGKDGYMLETSRAIMPENSSPRMAVTENTSRIGTVREKSTSSVRPQQEAAVDEVPFTRITREIFASDSGGPLEMPSKKPVRKRKRRRTQKWTTAKKTLPMTKTRNAAASAMIRGTVPCVRRRNFAGARPSSNHSGGPRLSRCPGARGRGPRNKSKGRSSTTGVERKEMLEKLRAVIEEPAARCDFKVDQEVNYRMQTANAERITVSGAESDNNCDVKVERSDHVLPIREQQLSPEDSSLFTGQVQNIQLRGQELASQCDHLASGLQKITTWLDSVGENLGSTHSCSGDRIKSISYRELMRLQNLCAHIATKLNDALKIIMPQVLNVQRGYCVTVTDTYAPATTSVEPSGSLVLNSNGNEHEPEDSSHEVWQNETSIEEAESMVFVSLPEDCSEKTSSELPSSNWTYVSETSDDQASTGNAHNHWRELPIIASSSSMLVQSEDQAYGELGNAEECPRPETTPRSPVVIEDSVSTDNDNTRSRSEMDWGCIFNYLMDSEPGDSRENPVFANGQDRVPDHFCEKIPNERRKFSNGSFVNKTAVTSESDVIPLDASTPVYPRRHISAQPTPTYKRVSSLEETHVPLNGEISDSGSAETSTSECLGRCWSNGNNRVSANGHLVRLKSEKRLLSGNIGYTTLTSPSHWSYSTGKVSTQCNDLECDNRNNPNHLRDLSNFPISTTAEEQHLTQASKEGTIQIICEHSYTRNKPDLPRLGSNQAILKTDCSVSVSFKRSQSNTTAGDGRLESARKHV